MVTTRNYLLFYLCLITSFLYPQSKIIINSESSVQSIVNVHPSGTTYHLKAGLYRLQQITPKTGDVFIGEEGTVLNGAELLEHWSKEGIYWTHLIHLDKPGQEYNECAPGFPACKFPEDLFKDDYPLVRDTSLNGVVSGKWFLDYKKKKIYLADNPQSHKMEISLARRAFGGNASHVTIRGLIVEKYAIPGHMAAIGDQYPGEGWIIENNEVRLNHGQGISFSGKAIIRQNKIHHNGQLGLRSSKANAALVLKNELAYNTLAEIGYNWTHEGGGAKFTVSDSLLIKENYAHDNLGPGLWTDIDNTNTIYEGNVCTNNLASGIFHEISDNVIIRNNVLSGNGRFHGAQILISTSRNSDIHHNKITIDAKSSDAIKIVQRNRGDNYATTNNNAHHNDITYLVNQRTTGAWADYQAAAFWKTGGNRYDYNHYHLPANANRATDKRWEWNGNKLSWKEFQKASQETHGTVDQKIK